MIAIVTALREELSPLLRRAHIDRIDRGAYVGSLNGTRVLLATAGPGVANAEKSLNDLLHRFKVDSVIAGGVAGAIAPHLRRGDIVSDRIATVEKITRDKTAIDADAIDMESDGWRRAAERAGVPIRIVRVIFDSADEPVPDFIGDNVDRGRVVRHAITHPAAIPALLRMRSHMREVCDKLAEHIAEAIASPEARLRALLEETSRTFALCIPLLNEGVREQVEIAYLLFRIADTFEDASHWPVQDRLSALDEFCELLKSPENADRFAEKWHAKKPASHAGYMRLIADVPIVIDAFAKMPAEAVSVVREHVIRSAKGMGEFVAMTREGRLQLSDMQQLRAYCYAVAGIVGEMLTELFLLNAPQLRSVAGVLRSRAAAFGEGLQLVNILKDSRSDFTEGRTYIPPGADRAEVIALARNDLDQATEYTLAIQNGSGPKGIVAFAALPVALARATLDRLATTTATKITRPQVFRITRRVRRAVERGRPPLELRSRDAAPNEVTLVHP
ncbi:MAG TPA: squalene/phytoene synthase family protein [Thermoanaerobaculia bacterium]|nr:squalene/phytoene synthase family protein [Thermoanaerobaculia bacterium]